VLLELEPSQQQTSAKLRSANHKNRSDDAVALAKEFVALGRAHHDERYFGYASAALQPWTSTSAPLDVVLLRADIAQHQHRFGDARLILDELLTRDPNHATGRLMRASLHMTQANPQAAQQDCQKLFSLRESFAATICLAHARSINGQLDASYKLVSALLNRTAADNSDPRHAPQYTWALGVAAEMAERADDLNAAERWLREILALDSNDLVARLDLADLLLRTGRAVAAVELLAAQPPSEPILLRRALAAKQLGDPGAASIVEWQSAIARSSQVGVTLHLRELARGQLDLLGNANEALRTALKNWEVQREPIDARLLADAARKAKNAATLQTLRDWQSALKFEDRGLAL
jgi:predicted Zn-dependent protease